MNAMYNLKKLGESSLNLTTSSMPDSQPPSSQYESTVDSHCTPQPVPSFDGLISSSQKYVHARSFKGSGSRRTGYIGNNQYYGFVLDGHPDSCSSASLTFCTFAITTSSDLPGTLDFVLLTRFTEAELQFVLLHPSSHFPFAPNCTVVIKNRKDNSNWSSSILQIYIYILFMHCSEL